MESLSSRHLPRKLSNGFSAKNAYDDVFSGPPKLRAQKRVEDYTEIFGGSRASSIPVLDLSADNDANGVVDLRSSKLDYSNIFGNFHGEEIGVSYEDLVANAGPRTPSVTGPPLQSSDKLKFSKENQGFTFDDKKQFNMSYHKTSLGSQDGTSGTIHVAQFQPLPGYTCFVDETTPQNKEADKRDNRLKVDFNEGIPEGKITKKPMSHLDDKQTFGRELKSRSGLSWDGSYANDKLFDAHDINLKSHPSKAGPPSRMAANLENSNGHSVHNINLKSHPSKVRLPSSIAANLENSNGHSKRFMTSYSEAHKNDTSGNDVGGDGSPPLFGEEIDVNSAAAASAAALKDAIQKAQESIRIAKELMQRKKEGLRSSSNWSFKDSLKVKDNRENILAHEGNRTEDKNAKDTHSSMDFSQVFSGLGRNSAVKSGEGVTDFNNNDRTSISGKVMGDAHVKNLDAAEKFEPATWFSTLMNIGKNRTVTSSIEQVVGKFRFGQYMDNHECDTKETMKEEEVIVREEKADEEAHELGEVERKLNSVIMEKESEDNVDKLESVCDACEHEEIEKPGISQEDEEIEEKETGLNRNEDCEMMLKESQQKIEDEITLESHELKENDFEKGQDKAQELAENENELQEVFQQEHVEKTTKDVDEEVDDETFEDASQWVEIENELTSEIDVYIVRALDIDEKRPTDGKENEEHFEECELEGNEKGVLGSYRYEETVNTYLETEKIEVIQEANYENDFNSESDAWSHDVSDNISETQEACQPEINHNDLETSQEVDEKENYITASFVQGVVEDSKIGESIKVDFEVRSEDSAPKFGFTDMDFGKTEAEKRDEELELNQKLESGIEILANGSVENGNVLEEDEVTFDEEAENSSPETSDVEKRCIDIMTDLETSHVSNMSQEKEETIEVDEEIRTRQNTEMNEENEDKEMEIDEEMKTSQGKEDNEENLEKLLTMEDDKEIKIVVPNKVLDNEYLRKIDEAKRREREREMDRIAVERAIREARERAFAIAREKAERAAVERATAEVRQRAMAEARGKLEKATTSTKSTAEKASMEAKIRSERAAVERATAEARERALEKALSQKTHPSRDNAMKKSFSSSDLHRSAETINSTESAPWNKGTLERHERIMERTAKALAEKNMRDLLAQKEQAEKNRLAESLDADIKRWSSGKEGNLRALLSTLQYILGPGSGWQPVSLTDIITTTAVKKAYRKATLYVHPDKLQQRGASIQQKYICEKVFDLLKAAWNRFNSEER